MCVQTGAAVHLCDHLPLFVVAFNKPDVDFLITPICVHCPRAWQHTSRIRTQKAGIVKMVKKKNPTADNRKKNKKDAITISFSLCE